MRRRCSLRTVARVIAGAALVAVAGGWFVLLRPASLGGPVAYVVTAGTSMRPTLRDGDLVVLRRQRLYRRGDIVAYRVPRGDPATGDRVIHRIVGGSARRGYVMLGDNKTYPDQWHPRPADVLGKEWFVIPYAGPVLRVLRSPLFLASLAAGLVIAVVALGGADERDRRTSVPPTVG
jgi:signal peptidase I